MKILYLSALVSEQRVNDEFRRTGKNPGFAVQKFSRLLVKGMIANGADVLAFSKHINGDSNKSFMPSIKETEKGVNYRYIPYINVPIIKHVCLFFYSLLYITLWGLGNRHEKAIVCDVLSVSTTMGALVAAKINRVLCVAVVTDIFSLMAKKNSRHQSFKVKFASKLNALYSHSFDKYILLTEQMNELVNPKGRPYMVMEALCNSSIIKDTCNQAVKAHPRVVLYAGGIHEIYGLKMLAEGFIKADVSDSVLVYYGSGSYVEEYKKLCEKHPNLEYRGVVPNDEIVEAELVASLLVNPRFSAEKFAKFSFPSKNMEYMASGTPLLTTNLPGMPDEYHSFVFLFEKETVDGYAESIQRALSFSESELYNFGQKARQFVLTNKNNIVQAERVLKFLF